MGADSVWRGTGIPQPSGHTRSIRGHTRHHGRAVRTQLALEALVNNADTLTYLSPEKRTELSERAVESGLLATVAVCNHANVLFVRPPTASVYAELGQSV